MDLKVLSTSLPSIPLRKGVYLLGSKVSVCAMPPAINSQITDSAVEGIREPALESQEDSNPGIGAPAAMVAILAADNFFKKDRLLCELDIMV